MEIENNEDKPIVIEDKNEEVEKKEKKINKKQDSCKHGFLGTFLFFASIVAINGMFVLGVFGVAYKNNFWINVDFSDAYQSTQTVKVVDEQSQVIDVAKNSSPAVVSIIATTEVPTYETLYEDFFNFQIPSRVQSGTEKVQASAGTGFIVSSDGYIITNKHVVEDEDAEYTVILNNEENFDEKVEAEVLAMDPDNDIAILKIDKEDLPFLKMGDSDSLQIGQTAIAIGYALGEFDNTVSKGVVSGLYRSIAASGGTEVEYLQGLIQTDAAVNPGNSGGPLLDIEGNVIGVNVAMADAQSIGFAIPINEVKEAYDEVVESGIIQKDTKAFLGVRYMDVNENVQDKNNVPYNYGAIIVRGENEEELAVMPGSPADKAGISENDIILEIDGEKITSRNSLQKIIGQHEPGDTIKIKIYQDGEEKEVEVILEEK